ncbi:antitoxin [Sphingomonas phyllosphaerae]|uniref:antitoxin n=1 Tax=Sphingomonas phyllosphaerae TaxID=257003 RepID=UPI00241354CE|nr:antitoxin [Sphingomonas phyllosphaerae]
MEQEAGIFEERDPDAEDASVARARADLAAGRVYSHEEVVAWLKTWGTDAYRPFPRRWRG